MSLNCEPTELTPLRRTNCSRRQQQQQQQQEHYTPEHIEHIVDDDDDADRDGNGGHDIHNHELYLGGQHCNNSQLGITVAATESALPLNHLQSPAFSEYMSINNNNNNNHHPHHHPAAVGSDSSRADTSEPNSQQALNPKVHMMSDTKRIITRVSIDFVVLLAGESLLYITFFVFIFIFNCIFISGFFFIRLFHLCITSNKLIVYDGMFTCHIFFFFFSFHH